MKRLLYLFFSFTITASCCFGQNQIDNYLWGSLSIEKDFSKKFSASLQEEGRLNNNFSELDRYSTELDATYKLVKGLKVGLGYRFIQKYTNEEEFSYRHRMMFDLSYKYKISRFSFLYRTLLQAEVKNYNSSKNGKNPAWFWRNKLEVKYSIKKFSPYVGAEIYYQIKDSRNPELDKGWHKKRIFLGVDYKLNKKNEFGLYYLIQRGIDDEDSNDMNVIGLRYSFTLPYVEQ